LIFRCLQAKVINEEAIRDSLHPLANRLNRLKGGREEEARMHDRKKPAATFSAAAGIRQA